MQPGRIAPPQEHAGQLQRVTQQGTCQVALVHPGVEDGDIAGMAGEQPGMLQEVHPQGQEQQKGNQASQNQAQPIAEFGFLFRSPRSFDYAQDRSEIQNGDGVTQGEEDEK